MSSSSETIVVLNSSRFGQGNPRLGESLMEDFLAVCAKSNHRPDALFLYNSAVVLACKDSKVLDSLKALEKSGCFIAVNAESLVFYSLQTQLECGEECSIDEMSERLLAADAVIKP